MDESTREKILYKYITNRIPPENVRPQTILVGNWVVYIKENGDIGCVQSGTNDEIIITKAEAEDYKQKNNSWFGGRRRRRTRRHRGSKKHRKSHRRSRSRSHRRSRRHH